MYIETLKYYIQSADINFLYGFGLPRPFFSVLSNIEKWLAELNVKRYVEGFWQGTGTWHQQQNYHLVVAKILICMVCVVPKRYGEREC